MTIGIDIDDTLTETSKIANLYLKQNKKYKDLVDYHLLDTETFERFVAENIESIQKHVPLKDGAKDFIDNLRESGNKVIIITARGSNEFEFLINITLDYFKDMGIDVDEIVFAQERKGDACLKCGVEIFIDDKEEVLDEVKTKGIKTLRFCEKGKTSKHTCVSSWKEVQELFNKGVLL